MRSSNARRQEPIETAGQLAEIVRRAIPGPRKRGQIDPATRTFQALRIAVNEELKSLEIALRRIPDCLQVGGRLGIISFHSLEDRRVKEAFRDDRRLEVADQEAGSAGGPGVPGQPAEPKRKIPCCPKDRNRAMIPALQIREIGVLAEMSD